METVSCSLESYRYGGSVGAYALSMSAVTIGALVHAALMAQPVLHS